MARGTPSRQLFRIEPGVLQVASNWNNAGYGQKRARYRRDGIKRPGAGKNSESGVPVLAPPPRPPDDSQWRELRAMPGLRAAGRIRPAGVPDGQLIDEQGGIPQDLRGVQRPYSDGTRQLAPGISQAKGHIRVGARDQFHGRRIVLRGSSAAHGPPVRQFAAGGP